MYEMKKERKREAKEIERVCRLFSFNVRSTKKANKKIENFPVRSYFNLASYLLIIAYFGQYFPHLLMVCCRPSRRQRWHLLVVYSSFLSCQRKQTIVIRHLVLLLDIIRMFKQSQSSKYERNNFHQPRKNETHFLFQCLTFIKKEKWCFSTDNQYIGFSRWRNSLHIHIVFFVRALFCFRIERVTAVDAITSTTASKMRINPVISTPITFKTPVFNLAVDQTTSESTFNCARSIEHIPVKLTILACYNEPLFPLRLAFFFFICFLVPRSQNSFFYDFSHK